MNAPVKLSLFGLCLVVVFAAALGVGRLVGPGPAEVPDEHQEMAAGHHQLAGCPGARPPEQICRV
ncbi:hypothetical protein AB0H87_37700, partial [Asanoa sp. NPDC050611]